MSEVRWRVVVAAMATAAMAAWIAGAQDAPRTPAATRTAREPAEPPAVATVGPLRITQTELEQRAEQAAQDYKGRTGSELPAEIAPLMQRQLLESLIRRDLLVLEARRQGLLGSERAAEAELRKDPFFQVNGGFDSVRYEQVRRQDPAAFATALQSLRQNLAAHELLQRLQTEKSPNEAALRTKVTRALTRATVEYLVLRRAEFDGSHPEPREKEILDSYHAHLADYLRPPRATLSVVFADQPALSDSEAAIPSAIQAWTDRMRRTADSILAAVKTGRTLEEASESLGGPRTNQAVVPGNLPGYWLGSDATNAAVFATPPGTVLPAPVPTQKGWLVVRVDQVDPAHAAPLQEVAREIRSGLRSERRQASEDPELRTLYDALRDSLRVTAYRLRYAVADTGALDPGQPRAADLERYYRAHVADYSSFSNRDGAIVTKSFNEVRADVLARLLRDRRLELSRAQANQLVATWARKQRDFRLEQRLHLREVGPVAIGAPADTGLAGRVLTDSLAQRQGALGPGLARSPRGWVAFDVFEAVPDHLPTFDQARSQLVQRRAAQRKVEEEEGARRLFEASPQRFAGGPAIHYTRAFVRPANMLAIPLTRADVERFHREHLDRYSAPELVRASHILISPRDRSPAADAEARARTDSLLERLRAGEDFAEMAKRVTDDPATRDNGGDLGLFRRGTMLPEVERAAFAMRTGDLSREPVKTPVGYHILKVHEYVPLVAQPLAQIYADVGADAATAKADSLARQGADSLIRVLRNAVHARSAAEHLGLMTLSYEHSTGERGPYPLDLHPYYQRLEKLKAGQVLPMTRVFGALGYAVTWVDSISPPGLPKWEKARDQALEAYRSTASQRALEAKQAELDSLMQAGVPFDSVAAAWGGLQRVEDILPGQRFPGIGAVGTIDTLVFGQKGDDGLQAGQVSDWITLPAGVTRLRTKHLRRPDGSAVTTRAESERRVEMERALTEYFESLKKRHPVRILDRRLRDVTLPQPPR